MTITTNVARAYVNFGRWISDCPLGCGNAMALQPGQSQFFCQPPGGCGNIASVEWPNDPDGIWEALGQRPMPKTRNWFPKNHELALRAGCPNGQSVQELLDEAQENQ